MFSLNNLITCDIFYTSPLYWIIYFKDYYYDEDNNYYDEENNYKDIGEYEDIYDDQWGDEIYDYDNYDDDYDDDYNDDSDDNYVDVIP